MTLKDLLPKQVHVCDQPRRGPLLSLKHLRHLARCCAVGKNRDILLRWMRRQNVYPLPLPGFELGGGTEGIQFTPVHTHSTPRLLICLQNTGNLPQLLSPLQSLYLKQVRYRGGSLSKPQKKERIKI